MAMTSATEMLQHTSSVTLNKQSKRHETSDLVQLNPIKQHFGTEIFLQHKASNIAKSHVTLFPIEVRPW